jgi:sigma-B regulation protein RsbU (phosphoserine phosphatase)
MPDFGRRLAECAVLLVLFSMTVYGQVIEAENCVYHQGDDPSWARPDYDDSAWMKSAGSPYVSRDAAKMYRYGFWMRCRLNTEPLPAGAQLFVQLLSGFAWRAWVNGIPAGEFGNPDTGDRTTAYIQRRPVPAAALDSRTLTIAVRFHGTWGTRGQHFHALAVGVAPSLDLLRWQTSQEAVSNRWPGMVLAPFLLAAGLILLVLSGFDPRLREIFWLGLIAMGFACWRLGDSIRVLMLPVPSDLVYALLASGWACVYWSTPAFFYAFRARKVPWGFRAAAVLAVLADASPIDLSFASLPVQILAPTVLWSVPFFAFRPWRGIGRGDAPLFATGIFWMLGNTLRDARFLTAYFPITLPRNLFNEWPAIGAALAIVTMAVILSARLRKVNDERDDLAAEMNAAQVLQRRLVPDPPSVDGFRIGAAYLPAREVGGDFYHFLPGADGSLLLVTGDVSGKGLDAAMVVSMIVGALQNEDSRQPEEILGRLNRLLRGNVRSGFVTCCAALFESGGRVEIANAGHIPPYLDGREVVLEPGPPLGIIDRAEYESTQIHAGSALTFFSDGVVEARSGTGELLGFERLAGLSVKPAHEIAKEAERWGQEDDITVVQVAYA